MDIKEGFIKLAPEHCKSNDGRLVPLTRELVEMFKAMTRGLPAVKVFTYAGRQIGAIKTAFKPACRRAGIEDFTFYDVRHTAIYNWRLQGHNYFRIMAATGHKTMIFCKRYNTVNKEELKALVGEKILSNDTYKTQENIASHETRTAPVAQGTEQRTSNPSVGGSNPPRRASNIK